MASNVLVIPRFRPLNKRELSEANGADVVVEFEEDHKAMIIKESADKQHRFTFDWVFPPTCTQAEVYHQVAEPLLVDVFNGFNTTIFAYGQTGSGKSHSMTGKMNDPELRGIIPRMVDGIFERIQESVTSGKSIEFTVKVSFVEIYNEQIRDLCDTRKDKLRLREAPTGVWIEDVTETYVESQGQVFTVMENGNANRAISSTNMNSESSRSHSVFIITVGQRDVNTGAKKGAKLTLVDLAGSEKVGKTGAEGTTLKEAQHINKSLSALGNVINALTSQPASKDPKAPKTNHIPYRDSKLTYLLSDSLGGNSKTLLIITGSPSRFNVEETLSTIRFGNRAKNIRNKPKANQERTAAEYRQLLLAAETALNQQKALFDDISKDALAYASSIAFVAPDQFSKRPLHQRLIPQIAKQAKNLGGVLEWCSAVGGTDEASSLSLDTSQPKTDLDESSPWGDESELNQSVPSTPVPTLTHMLSTATSTQTPVLSAAPSSVDSTLVSEVLADFGAHPAFADIIATSVSSKDSLFSISSAAKEFAGRITTLQDELQASALILESLQSQLSEANSTVSKYSVEAPTMLASLEEAKLALETMTSSKNDLELELEQNEELISQLRKQTEQADQRRITAVRDLKLEIEQITAERDDANGRVEELNTSIQSLQVSLDEVSLEKVSLETDKSTLENRIKDLSESITALENDRASLESQKSNLDGTIAELSAKLSIFEFARSKDAGIDDDDDDNIDLDDDEDSEERKLALLGDGIDSNDPGMAAAQLVATQALEKRRKEKKQHLQKLAAMEKQFETTLHTMTESNQKDLNDVRTEQQKKIAEIEAKHAAAIEELTNRKNNEIKQLQTTNASLSTGSAGELRALEELFNEQCTQSYAHFSALSLAKADILRLEDELATSTAHSVSLIESMRKKYNDKVAKLESELAEKDSSIAKLETSQNASITLIKRLYESGEYWKKRDVYNIDADLTQNTLPGSNAAFSQPTARVSLHSGNGKINPKFDTNPNVPLTPAANPGQKPKGGFTINQGNAIVRSKVGAAREHGGMNAFF